jgi:ADP-ribosylglycohydrolase
MGVDINDRFRGVLLGTAVGDSLGLPAEGISRKRLARLYRGNWRHRFVLGRGMVSDDTEHAIFVTQSLIEAPGSASLFARRLAMRLKLWLVLLPAGVGLATLRSTFRLLIGFGPDRSGVRSAGNGPSMRAAPIGAFFHDRPGMLREYVECSSRMTHTDARALTGAMAVALVTAWTTRDGLDRRPSPEAFAELLGSAGDDGEWTDIIGKIKEAVGSDLSVSEFAGGLGASDGISGYAYSTVPVALYAWYRHFGDFRETLRSVLDCGGDTDTAGAIAGAMAGAVTGEAGIPKEWTGGILDWPRGIRYMRGLSENLAGVHDGTAKGLRISYFRPGLILRNLLFLAVVLVHGFRRLLPPY